MHTHTKKANALHVTSQSDKTGQTQPPNVGKWIEADDIQTHTHARVENSTPKRPLNLTRLMTRKKKKLEKRGNSFSTRMYGQVLFRDVKVQVDPGM